MEQPNEKNSEEKSEDKKPSEPLINNNPINEPHKKENAKTEGDKPKKIKRKPLPIIITEDKRKDKNAINANIISGGYLLLSAIIFVVTYLLFTETKKATKAAQDSAIAAQNTYNEQRLNDSIMRDRDSSKSINDSNNERNRFRLDSASIKTAQNNFEDEHDSYLQIGNLDTISLKTNEPSAFMWLIYNLGQPAKVTKQYWEIIIDTPDVSLKEITKFFKGKGVTQPENMYVIKESPQFQKYFTPGVPPPENIEGLKTGYIDLYIYGKFHYINLINKRKKIYEFVIAYNVLKGYVYLKADNYYEKNSN